jgi:hypothetical protein
MKVIRKFHMNTNNIFRSYLLSFQMKGIELKDLLNDSFIVPNNRWLF